MNDKILKNRNLGGYLRHFANFAQVVNSGSITAAARRLGASPSAMSESVKIIEGLFEDTLLERGTSGVRLIGRGREVYDEANGILSALDRLAQKTETDRIAGELRISLPAEAATRWFDAALREIGQTYPDIALTLMVEDEMLDHLEHSRDLYIRISRLERYAGLTVLHRFPTRAALVGTPECIEERDVDDPDSIAQLCLISKPHAGSEALLPLIAGGDSVRFRRNLQVSDIVTRLALARASVGVTGCVLKSVEADLQSGRLRHLLPDQFGPPLWVLIGAPRRNPPARVVAVADRLAECFAAQ